jgi:hypothetical protein
VVAVGVVGITWLGQPAPAEVVQLRSDGWTRTEKILFAGVLLNIAFLLYQITRDRNTNANASMVGPGL